MLLLTLCIRLQVDNDEQEYYGSSGGVVSAQSKPVVNSSRCRTKLRVRICDYVVSMCVSCVFNVR